MRLAINSLFALALLMQPGLMTAGQTQSAPKTAASSPAGTGKSAARSGKAVSSGTKPVVKEKAAPVKPVQTPVTVTVRPSSEISGTAFTLGDIADITGEDKDMVARLSAVEIGAAPLPGLFRIITQGDVQVHLRASRLDLQHVELNIPPTLRISRAGHDIPVNELTKAAVNAAQDAIKGIPNATLEPVVTGEKMTVPAGKAQILAGAWRGTPESGTLFVPVSVTVDGKPIQVIEVTLHVHRKPMVLVARRQIEPHTILTADDVALAPTDLPPGFTDPITEIKEAVGKRTTRRLLPDAPIGNAALEVPPAIAFNDKITIEYIFGPLRITAPGLARQAGAIGETIRVYATDTKKDLVAVILDNHTVRISDSAEAGEPN